MSEIQDKINQILSNPEALKQVQSLGEQLGFSKPEPVKQPVNEKSDFVNDEMLRTFTRLAPMMKSVKSDDETTCLLNALKPFLSPDKQRKLVQAEKMIKFIRIIPMLKDNGLFF